jgi:hypothetical protein
MSAWGHMYRKHDIDNYIVYVMYIFNLFFKIGREDSDAKDSDTENAMV